MLTIKQRFGVSENIPCKLDKAVNQLLIKLGVAKRNSPNTILVNRVEAYVNEAVYLINTTTLADTVAGERILFLLRTSSNLIDLCTTLSGSHDYDQRIQQSKMAQS